MSLIIRTFTPTSHIVQTDDGNFHHIASGLGIIPKYGTQVFPCSESGEIISWTPEYDEGFRCIPDMEKRYDYLTAHLEECI